MAKKPKGKVKCSRCNGRGHRGEVGLYGASEVCTVCSGRGVLIR